MRFQLLDVKVKKNLWKYIFQCFLATLTILSALVFLNILRETAIIAALGASAFIVFTMPHQYSSDPRRLIGGYIVGITTGVFFSFISDLSFVESLFVYSLNALIVFGAIAVGIAILIMTITNTEHAPAAGIALGLVINQWNYLTIIFIVSSMLWMAIVKKILKPYLMNLTSPVKK